MPVRFEFRHGTMTGVAAVLTVVVFANGLPAAANAAAPFERLTPQVEHVVTGTAAKPVPYATDPAVAAALTRSPATAVWPAAATTTVDPSAAAQVKGVPIALSPAVTVAAGRVSAQGGSPAQVPAKVTLQVLDRASTSALPDALVVRVSRADGLTAASRTRLTMDYSSFRTAFGGDWARRLHLEALPACASSTPYAPQCQGRALPSDNNGTAVSADVDVPGSGQAPALLALTAGPSGKSGTFAATTLSATGTWEAGGSSGDFSWAYPVRVPPGLGGPEPKLTLGYSAQSVDGRHASTNNQPSWVGQGFDMWSGFVERRYKGCADDMGGTANNTTATGDQCWGTDNATMSLGGRTTELIRDDATGAWHPKADDGSRIEHLTGAVNGDDNGEYWKITQPDGTQYWFGLNRLPGWVSGKPVTNSAWTVPVAGNNTGEPCRQTTFDASFCTQAYRWNLDYVVDPRGNSMSYWYGTESNKYARNGDPAKVSTYIRGGYLTKIDYGTRTSAEFGNAPARVLFTVANRCLPNTTCDSAHPANWPDVPWDQNCAASTCTQFSPTFWVNTRLQTIKTQVWGGSAYRDVEAWTLSHSYPQPGDGTLPGLWLNGISHSGLLGGGASVPDVTFTGVQLPNRVDTVDGSPAMNWWRVASIRNGTGGEISVSYSKQECVPGVKMPTAPESNTMRCYPVIWAPEGATKAITDWFNKYVVDSVTETDHTGQSPRVLTTYTYKGAPGWHYTDDDGLTPAKGRTWSQWRGYEVVGTAKGEPGQQSYGEIRYFRGMDGDHLPSGTRHAVVTDSRNGTFTDADGYSGQTRERITYNGAGGAEISSILTDPWMSAPTATRTINGVTTDARHVNIAASVQRIALDGGRGELTTKTVNAFDSFGGKTESTDYGDVNDPDDDQCTKYTYARNTTAWLVSYVSRTQTYGLSCDRTPTSADQIIADARTSYDGQPFGAAPTKGEATAEESLKDWSNGTPAYITTTRTAYDGNGRVTDTWDVLNNHTTTAYTPATGGPLTRTVETNPLGFTTTTDLEPAWGATTGVTDPNGRRTDVGYDPLGRTIAVWQPGRVKGTQSANTTYAYLIRTDGPLAVTTNKLGPNGGYITGYTLYDGLVRPRQTQAAADGPTGGAVITDTLYDAAGRDYKINAAYVADVAPSTTLFTPAGDNQIAAQTLSLYDGSGRPTVKALRSLGVEKWRTSTYYGGDHTDVTPPAGGFATSTVIDGRNRTVARRQFHGGAPTGAFETTSYAFNARGLLAAVTDTAGNRWSYQYDARGRQSRVTDPDKGSTTYTYDDAGRKLTQTDARGQTLAYTYDALGRETAEYDGSVTGAKLLARTYDTLAKGRPTDATRFAGGNAYTVATTGYDPMYRPTGTRVTIPAAEGGLAGTYQIGMAYKADGSLASTTLPAAGGLAQETLTYSYSDLGRPASLGGISDYVTGAQYTRLGEPAVLTLSAGGPMAQIGFYYDEATRRLTRDLNVRETSPSTIADTNLVWSPAGDVTSIAEKASGDTQCLQYDELRRLAQAWTPSGGDCAAAPSATALGGPAPYWQSFTYDKAGDRAGRVEHSGAGDTTTSYAYPAAASAQPHALLSTTTTSAASGSRTAAYTYDATGNLLTAQPAGAGGKALTWDAEGRLASTADSGTGATAGYIYNPDGDPLIRHDGSGATLFLPGMEVRAGPAGQASCTRFYTFGQATVAQRTGSGVTWLMGDHQGTIQYAVDATTQAVGKRLQKPFGDPRGTLPAWPNNRGFVGGVTQPDGLVQLGARFYDAGTGRFISPDPVFDDADPAQMISYGYAANSPVTASDPSGLRYVMSDFGAYGPPPPHEQPVSPHPTPTSTPSPTTPSPQPDCGFAGFNCWGRPSLNAVGNALSGAGSALATFGGGLKDWAWEHRGGIVAFGIGLGCGLAGVATLGAAAIACLGAAAIAGTAWQVVPDLIAGKPFTAGSVLNALGDVYQGFTTGYGLGALLRLPLSKVLPSLKPPPGPTTGGQGPSSGSNGSPPGPTNGPTNGPSTGPTTGPLPQLPNTGPLGPVTGPLDPAAPVISLLPVTP
ncbi:type IV secretion protein Rhs [Streptosporangiaceae bacterium NEAU-GS5]|nr:type IV secretion protein Rhs [Streptosporangiaceae bacterium NEAU-GS5]